MPEIGWTKIVHKVEFGFPAVPVPKATWTTLIRYEYADLGGATLRDPGPAILGGSVGATLPAVLPKDIKARWLRPGGDATDITGLVVGSSRTWSAVIPAILEFLSLGDFPLDMQLWQNGEAITVPTAIAAIYVPMLYAVSRLTIGVD